MEESNLSAQVEEQAEESTSEQSQDSEEITVADKSPAVVNRSLVRLGSLPSPSVSPRLKRKLHRSLSYPPTTSHVCHFNYVYAGWCLCPLCPVDPIDQDVETAEKGPTNNTSGRKRRGERRRRQSGGSIRTCQNHKLASMRDSLSGSQESLQEANLVLVDTAPSVSATLDGVLFQQGEDEFIECQVCYLKTMSRRRPCCRMPVCDVCLQTYIREKVGHRVLNIRCPNPACCDCICREEILHHLSSELYTKFLRFLVEDNSNPNQKTCPRCNHIANFNQDVIIRKRKTQQDDQQVQCACGLLWCFPCHAPWHEKLSCKQYQKGDRLLREWAKEHHYGQPNANKCPKCKVYIQRSSGCDNMTCSQCRTSFCYRCGERFYHVKFFGNHYSRLSVFGCKYRFKPHEPVKRKMIRGAIFGCKLAVAPVCITLAAGVGGVIIVALAPAYITFLARNEFKKRRYARRRQRQINMHRQYQEYSRSLYAGHDRADQVLRPRAATLIDLPPSSWQLPSEDNSEKCTEV